MAILLPELERMDLFMHSGFGLIYSELILFKWTVYAI